MKTRSARRTFGDDVEVVMTLSSSRVMAASAVSAAAADAGMSRSRSHSLFDDDDFDFEFPARIAEVSDDLDVRPHGTAPSADSFPQQQQQQEKSLRLRGLKTGEVFEFDDEGAPLDPAEANAAAAVSGTSSTCTTMISTAITAAASPLPIIADARGPDFLPLKTTVITENTPLSRTPPMFTALSPPPVSNTPPVASSTPPVANPASRSSASIHAQGSGLRNSMRLPASSSFSLHGPRSSSGPPAHHGGGTVKRPTPKKIIPSRDHLFILNCTQVCNLICLICGMIFCYSNLILAISTPIVTAIVIAYNRKYKPNIHRRLTLYPTYFLCCLTFVGAIVGFTSGFWKYPDFEASIVQWVKYILPSTYPFFILFGITSTATMRSMNADATESIARVYKNVEADQAQPVVQYSTLSAGRIVSAKARDATIAVFIAPDSLMQQYLVRELGIDAHVVNSCLDANELSRVECNANYTAIMLKLPSLNRTGDNYYFKVESAGVFLFEKKLVVIMREAFPLFESRLFTDVSSLADLTVRLLYHSVYSFESHLRLMNSCCENLEFDIARSTENSKLMQLFTLEKNLVYYINAIGSTGRTITKFSDKDVQGVLKLTGEQLAMMEDIAIENTQCYKMAHIYLHVIGGLMDARSSIISNNLNVMMKTLTCVMIAIGLPNFVSALGGMSEFSAMVGWENAVIAYPTFVVVMGLTGAAVFFTILKSEPLFAYIFFSISTFFKTLEFETQKLG
ncbi:divalent metal ion transporter [Pelomyxa schiedti]|nr:divalent metal ion transporter [Pelomyxa schiedti]